MSMALHIRIRRTVLRRLYRYLNRRALKSTRSPWINERPIEYAFALRSLAGSRAGKILDVGSGESAFPALLHGCGYNVTAVDNVKDYWRDGMYNRHFNVQDENILASTMDSSSFDALTCISVLEHIVEHEVAMREMARMLTPGGLLILTVPYCEDSYVPNAYALPGSGYGQDNPYVCQIYSREQVDIWKSQTALELIAQEYWRVFDGEYWTCGAPLFPRLRVDQTSKHQLSCLLFAKK
jgi:SAM-dependent methyltransferase